MNFKKFLVEQNKALSNEIDLVYQQILDNLDEGHVHFEDGKLLFNVGKIIKNNIYNNLDFVIRVQNSHNVRLGKDKQNKSAIVVDTTGQLPDRKKLNSFLESARYSGKIKSELRRYFKLHHEEQKTQGSDSSTSYEKQKTVNTNFEDHYEQLVHAIEQKLLHTSHARDDLMKQHDSTGNIGKQEIIKAASKHLIDTELGTNFNKFKGIALKLPEAEFIQHLDPAAKKKILSRLESYYEHRLEKFNN